MNSYSCILVSASNLEWDAFNKKNEIKKPLKEFVPGVWVTNIGDSYTRISFFSEYWRYSPTEKRLWLAPLRNAIENYFNLQDFLRAYSTSIDILILNETIMKVSDFSSLEKRISRTKHNFISVSDVSVYFLSYIKYLDSVPIRDRKSGKNILSIHEYNQKQNRRFSQW